MHELKGTRAETRLTWDQPSLNKLRTSLHNSSNPVLHEVTQAKGSQLCITTHYTVHNGASAIGGSGLTIFIALMFFEQGGYCIALDWCIITGLCVLC